MSWQCSKVQEHPKNFTYIVECSDGTLYTGWTNNLEKRLKDHNNGNGAKYTKDALESLITGLQDKGYTIVPISELIYTEDYYMDHEGRQFQK